MRFIVNGFTLVSCAIIAVYIQTVGRNGKEERRRFTRPLCQFLSASLIELNGKIEKKSPADRIDSYHTIRSLQAIQAMTSSCLPYCWR